MKLGVLVSLFSAFVFVEGLIELTNIKCNTVDKSFSKFDYCYIRSVNRTYKYMSLKVKLFQIPVTNVTIGIDMRKRANDYKPFLYNFTFDACKFFRSKEKNPLILYFYDFFEKYSNMNHTCPYNHDIILDKLDVGFINNRVTNLLPFPQGDYAVFTTWTIFNVLRAKVDAFATLS